MKKNLKAPLRLYNGASVKVTETENGKEVTKEIMICDQIGQALWECSQSTGLSPQEKYQAFKIAQRIARNPEKVELSTEDIALIKRIIGGFYSPGFYGQMVELLEGESGK